MKILVLGTTGQLGWQLMRDLAGGSNTDAGESFQCVSPEVQDAQATRGSDMQRQDAREPDAPVRSAQGWYARVQEAQELDSLVRFAQVQTEKVQVLGVARKQLDVGLDDRTAIETALGAIFDQHQPALVINAIAYTAVDLAESEPELAAQVNGWFPGMLGRHARATPVVHFSSDYVFDGRASGYYRESDDPSPLGVYGASKLAGERGLLEANDRALVLRCSWVVGAHGQNFAKTILRLACERDRLRVVSDQCGVPTPAGFIVDQLRRAIFVRGVANASVKEQGEEAPAGAGCPTALNRFDHTLPASLLRMLPPSLLRMPSGLFHLVPSGETSWYHYALWILAQASRHPGWRLRLKTGEGGLEAISSAEYPTAAPRPLNSRLDTTKWRDLTGQRELEDWRISLSRDLAELLSASPA
jgi:dTDP-4-dehydrorhamnose reductase